MMNICWCDAAGTPRRQPPNRARLCVLVLGIAATASSWAQSPGAVCDVESSKAQMAGSDAGLLQALFAKPFTGARCDSVRAVFRQLSNRRVLGGRKLEPDKPLDVAAAREQRATAAGDAAFVAALAQESEGETEPRRRKLIEAAMLHEHGYVRARDFALQELLPARAP